VVLQPLPHLYPFIVNDPGEGTQAKRRSHAVIVDHLTPPLGRAGLHGQEAVLEQLLDEYWEAQQLGSSRVQPLRAQLRQLLVKLHLTDQPGDTARAAEADPEAWLDGRLNAADGYLCELKEAQIRLGLHRLGSRPEPRLEGELLLALARAPGPGRQGLTQALADDLQLGLDPWRDGLDQPLDSTDLERLRQSGLWSDERLPGGHGARLGDAIALLEAWCLDQLQSLLDVGSTSTSSGSGDSASSDSVAAAHVIGCGPATQRCLEQVRQHLLPRLTACAEREREALMGGLDGGRIAAGPAGAPTRGRPDVLPTGRNFYSVDPRGLPTETAWALGCKAADQLLERHLQDEGEPLRHLALSVWGTATMRNGGDEVAQCLALMGVRPLWDGVSRRVHDLEVIPQHQLGRPRLHITLRISGFFRDAFPSLIQLLGKADRLVHQASLLEHDASASASGTTAAFASASAPGCETEQAAAEGLLRIYGSAPGAYGAGLQGLIESGAWEESADLATAFLHWSGWRYGSDGSGGVVVTADREGLERRLGDVDAVLHNQDNREHDLLDSDDYYQFQGGLTAAVTTLRGERPATWFGDHSRPDQPRVHGLRRELDKVIRSRLLNPRWLEGMQRHGYKGGFELAASLDYLFAYDATTAMVPDWVYGAITERWLRNPAVRQFLEQKNPWALRDMGERLLEAHHRGLWDGADDSAIGLLQQLVRDSDALLEQGGGKANGGGGSADH
ncbi:MAG: cobaltochelatase subunit CobN, partial [Aphanocapsa feldmannii 277cI]